jgi:outer membrane protein OmpA-like peptidoglycan-associated protein
LADRVHFASNTDTLSVDSRAILDEVAGALTAHAGVRVAIRGRVESLGDLDFHSRLAEERVQSVVDYLVRRGASRSSISIQTTVARRPLQIGGEGRRGRIRGGAWPELDRARERRVDLSYTSSEDAIIRGVSQEDDMQVGGGVGDDSPQESDDTPGDAARVRSGS